MKNGILEIDHLLTKVDDPQRAGERMEQLGFTVTPLSGAESRGVCNRIVLFEPFTPGSANFIELMGVVDQQRMGVVMRELLAGPEGTRSMVLATPDADAARAELLGNGYPAGEVQHIERDWVLPGETLHVAFDVILPLPAPLPFNLCRYHTLQHYLRPEWAWHANAIRGLEAVYGVVADPADGADYYSALFGAASVPLEDGVFTVSPGRVALTLYSPAAWQAAFGLAQAAPGFTGYRLRSVALDTTKDLLARAGVGLAISRRGDLFIPPQELFGNLVHVV